MVIDEKAATTVGRLILIAAELDAQLNAVCMEALLVPESHFGLPLVATLDAPRKIEILKSWAKHLEAENWRKMLTRYAEEAEEVMRLRNIAAHSLYRQEGEKFTFASLGAAKLLKSIEKPGKAVELAHLDAAFERARATLQMGEEVYQNFQRVRLEMGRRAPAPPVG